MGPAGKSVLCLPDTNMFVVLYRTRFEFTVLAGHCHVCCVPQKIDHPVGMHDSNTFVVFSMLA